MVAMCVEIVFRDVTFEDPSRPYSMSLLFKTVVIATPLLQGLIFGCSMDHVFKAALRGHRNYTETLEMSGPAEILDEVKAAHKQDYAGAEDQPLPPPLAEPEAEDEDAHMKVIAPSPAPPKSSGQLVAGGAEAEEEAEGQQSMPAIDEEKLAAFRGQARRTVATHVKLIVADDQQTENNLVSLINESAVGRFHGKLSPEGVPLEYLGVFFDTKLAGEALTAPHVRIPPLKDGRLPRLMSIILKSRCHDFDSQKPSLDPADLFFFADGCKRG